MKNKKQLNQDVYIQQTVVQPVSHKVTNIFSFQMGSTERKVKNNPLDVNINPFATGQCGMTVRTVISVAFSLLRRFSKKSGK